MTIETNGDITGTAVAGINAKIGDQNNTSGNGELNITANAAVTGGQYGIFARHYGLGAVTIKTGDRDVTGTNEYGIFAEIFNANNTNDIKITTGTGAVKGRIGIHATHQGAGALTIETNGDITGTKNDGIFADIFNKNNTNDLKITTGTGAVTGALNGIAAQHLGKGAVTINTGGGDVTGQGSHYGIRVYVTNRQNDSALTITTGTGAVKGGLDGIFAKHRGTGALTIETNGNVTGRTLDGINALIDNTNNNNALTITTGSGNVIGKNNGIFVEHQGFGNAVIAVNGLVQGRTQYGIDSREVVRGMTRITLNNNAHVRGARGKAAIINGDGNSQLTVNEGSKINGDVTLGGGKDEVIFLRDFDFSKVKNGEFDGGGGDQDEIVFRNRTKNAAAVDADQFKGFERATIDGGSTEFTGQPLNLGGATGLLSLINGGTLVVGTQFNNINGSVHNKVGSTIDMQDSQFSTLTITGDYTGGGTIRMDTVLGDSNSDTDRIIITGSTSGPDTMVHIENRGGQGSKNANILLIDVGGQSNGNFILADSFINRSLGNRRLITVGAYAYNLEKTQSGDWYLNSEMTQIQPTPDQGDGDSSDGDRGGGNQGQPGNGQPDQGKGDGDSSDGDRGGGNQGQPGNGQPDQGKGDGDSSDGDRGGGNQGQPGNGQPDQGKGDGDRGGGKQPGRSGDSSGGKQPRTGGGGGPRIYSPGAVAYENLAHTALELNRMESLHERVGSRVTHMTSNRPQSTLTLGAASQDAGLLHEGDGGAKANPDRWLTSWARMSGRLSHQSPGSSTTGVTERDTQVFKLQGGVDAEFVYDNDNTAVFGLNASLSHGKTDFSSIFGNGEIKTTGIGVGLTGTWYGPQGFYADVQGTHTWYSSDLTSDIVGKLADGVDGTGLWAECRSGQGDGAGERPDAHPTGAAGLLQGVL